MSIPFTEPAPCAHEGPCSINISPRDCGIAQLAHSLKYSTNHAWQFAEIAENIFVLYNPIRREPVLLGTFEEILAAYRKREPFVPIRREELPLSRPSSRFQNVKVNI